jgi:hypothetical protein
MYCSLHVPQLQRVEGLLAFIHGHLDQPIASTSVIAPMSRDFAARLGAFADARARGDAPRWRGLASSRLHAMIARSLPAFRGKRFGTPARRASNASRSVMTLLTILYLNLARRLPILVVLGNRCLAASWLACAV